MIILKATMLLSDESIDSDKWQEKLKPKEGAQETQINNGSVLFNKLLKHQNLNDSMSKCC